MAFVPWKEYVETDTETYILANSQTFYVGQAVGFAGSAGSAGYLSPCGPTSTSVYGVIVGFVQSPGGSSQQNLTVQTLTTASNNTTVDKYRARVLPVMNGRLFVADLSSAAGTTTGSADPGYFALASGGTTLNESSYVVPTGTANHFFSLGAGGGVGNNASVGLDGLTSSQVLGFFVKGTPSFYH